MKKSSKTILIPIETVSRELDYKVYISMYLAYRGCSVILGKKQYINHLINKFKHYIYIDKGYHEGFSDDLYKKIKSRKGLIINLDEEGAVDFSDNSTLLNRYSKNMIKNVDKVFFWGENQKKMIKNSNIDAKKLVVTGHPRFHLMKDKFFGLYKNEIKEIKKKYKGFILINTNFGFGNNIKGDDFVIKNYSNRFKNIRKIINEDKKKLDSIILLVNKLSQKHKIILRPHPEELLLTYSEIFDDNSNVKIKREKSSIPWIIACKTCIHIDCTTGIEAAILKKRVISYVPNSLNKKFLTELPIKVSEIYSNYDKILLSLENNKRKIVDKNKVLQNYFSLNLNLEFFFKQLNILINKDNFNSYKSKSSLSDYYFYLKMLIKKLFSFFTLDSLERSKLKDYNMKSFLIRFNFYKKKIKKFSNIKITKKGDLYYFNKL